MTPLRLNTNTPFPCIRQINSESAHILKMLAQKAPEKVASHTRSQQKLILRSAAQSTSIVVPSVHEGNDLTPLSHIDTFAPTPNTNVLSINEGNKNLTPSAHTPS